MKPQMKKFLLDLLEEKYIKISTTKQFINEKLVGMKDEIDIRVKEEFELKAIRNEVMNIKLNQELEYVTAHS